MSNFDPDTRLVGHFCDRETGRTLHGMATFLKHVTAAGGPVAFTRKLRADGYAEGHADGVEVGRVLEREVLHKTLVDTVQVEVARALAAREGM